MIFSTYLEEVIGKLESEGENFINRLRADSTEENLQLEFKTKKSPAELELHKEDKQNLGKALSGFSNAEGGIVIWGVGTKKENGIDKANQLRPISNIENSFEVFRNQCATSLQPENPDLKFLLVRCGDDNTKGYIAVAVPKGRTRPYMSKAPDHSKYFRRTPNGFDPLQHYEVVDMMRAEVDADIVLNWTVTKESTGPAGTNFRIRLLQHNIGLVSALRPYTIFESWPAHLLPSNIVWGNLKMDPPEIGQRVTIPSLEMEGLIPTGVREFMALNFHTKGSWEGPFHWGRTDDGPSTNFAHDLELKAIVGAENGTAKKMPFKFTLEEVRIKCLHLRTL